MLTLGTAIAMLTIITAIVAGCSEWVLSVAWLWGHMGNTTSWLQAAWRGYRGRARAWMLEAGCTRLGVAWWRQGVVPVAARAADVARLVGRGVARVASVPSAGRAHEQQHTCHPGWR